MVKKLGQRLWLFCVFIVYAMCDKNTISKTEIISK